jgi:predicted peptidase
VQLAIAQIGVSRIIPVEETKKLKAIRNEIGSIKNLDALYEDRKHKNGLPYHFYVPKHLKAGVKYPVVIFLHGYTDLTIDTHKGFPKGVWSLPKIQKAHPHILFVPRNRKKEDNWSSDEYRTMTINALDDMVAELNDNPNTPNADVNRLYLTGFSRGGDKGVKGSRISFKALKDAGAADVRYHEYKSQGHVIDDFAYFTDGFMEWMFSQKRKK